MAVPGKLATGWATSLAKGVKTNLYLMFNGVQVAVINAANGLTFAATAVTGAAGASTANAQKVIITTESLTTAAGATYTETLTNSYITANSVCVVGVATAGTGTPVVTKVTPAAGSVVIIIQNIHASAAFNAALTISVLAL